MTQVDQAKPFRSESIGSPARISNSLFIVELARQELAYANFDLLYIVLRFNTAIVASNNYKQQVFVCSVDSSTSRIIPSLHSFLLVDAVSSGPKLRLFCVLYYSLLGYEGAQTPVNST